MLFLICQLPSFGPTPTPIALEKLVFGGTPELGRKLPFLEKVTRQATLKASDDVFTDDREELIGTMRKTPWLARRCGKYKGKQKGSVLATPTGRNDQIPMFRVVVEDEISHLCVVVPA